MAHTPHSMFLDVNRENFVGDLGMYQYSDDTESVLEDLGYGFRGESHDIGLPMKVSLDQPCQFLHDVVDECYQSRLYSRALEYYLLESDSQTAASHVRCLLSDCPSIFPNAWEMLRHLKKCPHFGKGRFNCPTCNKSEKFRTASRKSCSWNRSTLITKFQKGMHASAELFRRFSGSKPSKCPRCNFQLRDEPRTCRPPSHNEVKSSKSFEMNISPSFLFNHTTMRTPAEKGPVETGISGYLMGPDTGRYELEVPLPPEADASYLPAELCDTGYQMPQPTFGTNYDMTSVSSHPYSSNSSPTDISSASTEQEATISSNVSPTSSTKASNRISSCNKSLQQYHMGALDQRAEQRASYGTHNGFNSDLSYAQSNGSGYPQNPPASRGLRSSNVSSVSDYVCPMLGQTDFHGARQPSPLTIHTDIPCSESVTWGPGTFTELSTPVGGTFKGYSPEMLANPIRRYSSTATTIPIASFKQSPSPLSSTMTSPAESDMQDIGTAGDSLQCPECPFKPTGIEENLRSYLNKHMKTHEVGKVVKCPQCDKRFTRQDNATQHVKKVHGDSLGKKRPGSSGDIQLVPQPKRACG